MVTPTKPNDRIGTYVGRLDGLASILPDASLFIYLYVRKEAVLSSQIEGTQSSLSDLMLFESAEAPGAPLEDVQEVSNYVAAKTLFAYPVQLRIPRRNANRFWGFALGLSSHFLDPSPTREEGTNRGGFNLNQRFRRAAQ
jgi:hypothetical protein